MSEQIKESRGTLKIGEPHPAVYRAYAFIKSHSVFELFSWQEAFSSCAIEGNRLAEVCAETLNRILTGQPVSDRYVLGLAWAMLPETKILKCSISKSATKSSKTRGRKTSSRRRAKA